MVPHHFEMAMAAAAAAVATASGAMDGHRMQLIVREVWSIFY